MEPLKVTFPSRLIPYATSIFVEQYNGDSLTYAAIERES